MIFSNLNNIIAVIKKYMNNERDANNITYVTNSNTIKVKIDVSILFIITDIDNNIQHIDLCYQNCMIKKYINHSNLMQMQNELKEFIGLEL